MTLNLTNEEAALLRKILEQTAAIADRMSLVEHLGLDFDEVTGEALEGDAWSAKSVEADAIFASLQSKLV